MKLLYLSCHAILEYDELRIFEELGIDYFSLGSYIIPENPVDPIRPALGHKPHPDLLRMAPERDKLQRAFVDRFDTIMVMHVPEWIEANWTNIRHKRVIWRTIGQSTPAIERRMAPFRADGLEVVRYSPREIHIPNYIGEDAMIRFYKDPEEFGQYNGMNREAITFAQNMVARGDYCHFNEFEKIVEGLPAHVYGPKNEEAWKLNGGFLGYQEMQQKMRDSRVYIYTGTQPANYTLNFIESWMTGIPIVALGSELSNTMKLAGDAYEIPDLITNGLDGVYADDLDTLKKITEKLMDDPEQCKSIGRAGRDKAIEIFGKDRIKLEWKKYLGV